MPDLILLTLAYLSGTLSGIALCVVGSEMVDRHDQRSHNHHAEEAHHALD